MKLMIGLAGLITILASSPLWGQTIASTSGWDRSYSKNFADGGPVYVFGNMSWKEDGSSGSGQCISIGTPGEHMWNEDYLDAPKAMARMRKGESPGFEFEYITFSGQSLRMGCRKVGVNNWGAFHVFMDHYEPGKGYKIYRKGILLFQEFFDPQPVPPQVEVKETGPNQVEWQVQRSPKLESYQVRISWDEGGSWFSGGFKDNHVVLNMEESQRKLGIQPWIEFQIAQGFVVTAKKYVMGKGFTSIN